MDQLKAIDDFTDFLTDRVNSMTDWSELEGYLEDYDNDEAHEAYDLVTSIDYVVITKDFYESILRDARANQE